MIVRLPFEKEIGVGFLDYNTNMLTERKVKLGVYGSYKKGFHNHEMLGKDAKFDGMSKLKGVMYLVDGINPFPLLYIDSVRAKTMEREYLLELYEIEDSDFQKIQSKELRENGRLITVTIDKKEYIVFVTNKKEKQEPEANDYIKSFNKNEFEAYIHGPVTIYALDEKKAEEQLKELFEKAADSLDTEKHEDAATVLRQLDLIVYRKEDKKDPPKIITAQEAPTSPDVEYD